MIRPERVHVGVDQHLDEREQEVEDQPDVDHFNVGGLWQVVWHIDEHGRQHEHSWEIKQMWFDLPVRFTVTTAWNKIP